MVIVQPYERALHYRRGALVGVLGPGRHRLRGFGHELVHVDVRERLLKLATQEVPTADGVRVKAGATLTWHVGNALAWHETSIDPVAVVHEAARLAVRDVVAALDLATATTGIPAGDVPAAVVDAAAAVGVEVTALRIGDVLPPAEVRRALEATVVARHRAEALLEETRGQTAAVRNLANVADLLDAHPALAALRLAEVAAGAGGSVVLERPAAP